MTVAIDSDVGMGRDNGIRSERVRKSWMSYACSQTDNLFSQGIGDTQQTLLNKRAVVYEHLDALRATETLLRERLNHLLPIYRLPDEILARVLVYSCAAKRTAPTFPDKLMMVSRKWYSVVCAFPEIWTYPPWTHSKKCISAFLWRAKAVPIHLDWDLPGAWITSTFRTAPYSAWMPRCQTVTLKAATSRLQVILPDLFNAEAPLLKSVFITVNRSWRNDGDPEVTALDWPSNAFNGNAPHFRALSLVNFGCFDWSDSVLSSSLAVLEVGFVHASWISSTELARRDPERANGCSFNCLLDALERMQNLEGLTLINCVSTSLLFGNPSDHRNVKLHCLRRLSVNDSPEACAAFNRAISVDDKRAAVTFGLRYTDQWALESIAEFIREIPISQRFTALEASVRHVDSKQRNVNFYLHHEFGGACLTLRATIFRPERGSSALFDSPNWYRNLWTTIAAALQLQRIHSLNIRVDFGAGALTKSMWLKSFSHAKLVTVLDVQSRHIPALSHALCPEKTPARTKVSQCLFPRLGVVLPRDTTEGDIYFLKRALRKRAPNFGTLGSFVIHPDAPELRQKRVRVVHIEPSGKRSPVRLSYERRYCQPGVVWVGFDARKALEAMLARQRARKQGKPSVLSVREHRETLDAIESWIMQHPST